MSYVLLSDLARYYCVSIALWVAVLLLVMVGRRIRENGLLGKAVPHPLSIIGTITLLIIAIVRRFDRIGQPGDGFLWAATFGITCLLIGCLINFRFTLTPPWRRDTSAREGVH